MNHLVLFFVSLLLAKLCFSQETKLGHLSKTLKEISGLEQLTDSTLLAINDGGNDACLYEINFNGKIIREITVINAKNIDWEDLAMDENKEYLFIGDFGNNANARKTLSIYKVLVSDIMSENAVNAKKVDFHYPEQKEYPETKKNRKFDCEAMAIKENRIYLFTKSNTKPYKGNTLIYSMTTNGKDFQLVQELNLGDQGYFQNSVTAADYFDGMFYLSSYSYVYTLQCNNKEFKLKNSIPFKRLTQKESLVVISKNEIILADENSPLGVGQNLYMLKLGK